MLHINWITEKIIDFEYQSYLLLAYLKKVNESFSQSKLFPYLPELISHQKNLIYLKNQKQNLAGKFPKKLINIDLQKAKMDFKPLVKDNHLMEEINLIVEYSLPKIEHYISEGNNILNLVKEKINIFPVGVFPIYANEGYMLISGYSRGKKRANVFQYNFSIYLNELFHSHSDLQSFKGYGYDDLYCNIQTNYVTTVTLSALNTFENIKTQLIKRNPGLPNPATFAIESEIYFPVNETLLPVAKKLLVNYVTQPNSKGSHPKE